MTLIFIFIRRKISMDLLPIAKYKFAFIKKEVIRCYKFGLTTVINSTASISLALLDRLYRQPIVNSVWVERELDVAKATAHKLLTRMEATGILRETTGFKRNRLFRYDAYVNVFDALAASEPDTTQG
jgi:hypothetical protein